MKTTTLLHDSLDNAVYYMIQNSELSNSELQYVPYYNLKDISSNSPFPLVTSAVTTGGIKENMVRANLNISIFFIVPEIDNCQTTFERNRRISQAAEYYKYLLFEMYQWLTGEIEDSTNGQFKCYNSQGWATYNLYWGSDALSKDEKEIFMDREDLAIVSMDMTLLDSYVRICCPVLNPTFPDNTCP